MFVVDVTYLIHEDMKLRNYIIKDCVGTFAALKMISPLIIVTQQKIYLK